MVLFGGDTNCKRGHFSVLVWTPACSAGDGRRGVGTWPSFAGSGSQYTCERGTRVVVRGRRVSLPLGIRSEHGSLSRALWSSPAGAPSCQVAWPVATVKEMNRGRMDWAAVADTLRISKWDMLPSWPSALTCSLLFPERRKLRREVTRLSGRPQGPWRKGSEPSPLSQFASCPGRHVLSHRPKSPVLTWNGRGFVYSRASRPQHC